jgi:hypothetical protein
MRSKQKAISMGEKFRNDATEPSSLRAWFQPSNFGLRDTPASADFVSQQFFSLDHFSYCVGRQIQQFSGLAWSQQRHVDWFLHSQPSSIALVYSEMRRLARTQGHYEQTQIPASHWPRSSFCHLSVVRRLLRSNERASESAQKLWIG